MLIGFKFVPHERVFNRLGDTMVDTKGAIRDDVCGSR